MAFAGTLRSKRQNYHYRKAKTLIEQSRQQVAVDATMSMLYWQIGKRINSEVLHNNSPSVCMKRTFEYMAYLFQCLGVCTNTHLNKIKTKNLLSSKETSKTCFENVADY